MNEREENKKTRKKKHQDNKIIIKHQDNNEENKKTRKKKHQDNKLPAVCDKSCHSSQYLCSIRVIYSSMILYKR